MRQELLESLRKEYPIGTRVELVRMEDEQAPPIGTLGTVKGVDDIGSIMVAWDNGSLLNVVYGEDECKVVRNIKTVCYGKTREWQTKDDAVSFFTECMLNSEGAERQRYFNILIKLRSGLAVCNDD